METNTIQQEILLVTTNSFSKRQFCEKDTSANHRAFSYTQKLEEACWSGLLPEILPGVLEKTASGKNLYLWHVRSGQSFLQLELSEFPLKIEKELSIDTTFFLSHLLYN